MTSEDIKHQLIIIISAQYVEYPVRKKKVKTRRGCRDVDVEYKNVFSADEFSAGVSGDATGQRNAFTGGWWFGFWTATYSGDVMCVHSQETMVSLSAVCRGVLLRTGRHHSCIFLSALQCELSCSGV